MVLISWHHGPVASLLPSTLRGGLAQARSGLTMLFKRISKSPRTYSWGKKRIDNFVSFAKLDVVAF